MDLVTLFITVLIVVTLSAIIINHWEKIFFLWLGFQLAVGLVATSWVTAFLLTFFNAFITEKWEGFNTRWLYSGVFWTAGLVIYFAIAFDLIDYGIDFIRKVFKIR